MGDQQAFARATEALIAAFARQPRMEPEMIAALPERQAFIEAVEAAGWTGPDMELDERFANRSAEWITEADSDDLRRWTHTLLRAERWNAECPMAVLEALQGGQLQALAGRIWQAQKIRR